MVHRYCQRRVTTSGCWLLHTCSASVFYKRDGKRHLSNSCHSLIRRSGRRDGEMELIISLDGVTINNAPHFNTAARPVRTCTVPTNLPTSLQVPFASFSAWTYLQTATYISCTPTGPPDSVWHEWSVSHTRGDGVKVWCAMERGGTW